MSATDVRGYKLVYVGKDHHLANSNGYAYEHRLIAEKKLGRRLKPGEVVHHLKEGKEGRGQNDSESIHVLSGQKEHANWHRTKGFEKQWWDEKNRPIKCQCGCGESLLRFDNRGRPRQFVSGHNSRMPGRKRV